MSSLFGLQLLGLGLLLSLAPGDAAASWPANGRPLCTASSSQQSPQIVTDREGGAIVVWQDRRSATWWDIYAQRVLASGEVGPGWPVDGIPVCTASGDQIRAQIISDGTGGAIVAWEDYRSGPSPFLYAQHVLASGAVDPAWPADGLAVCPASGEIVSDGAGGAMIVWTVDRAAYRTDTYTRRVLASGALDPRWPAAGLLVRSAIHPYGPGYPLIASDGQDGAFVTWTESGNGLEGSNIYAHHVLGTGTVDPAWPGDGLAVCTRPGDQTFPGIFSDAAGGAVVTWIDNLSYSPFTPAVYAQRVLATGVAVWPFNGTLVDTASHGYLDVQSRIVSDGTGGAIVGWTETWNYFPQFLQRVEGGGWVDPRWPTNGLALQVDGMISDRAGGAIYTRRENRGGSSWDIYAQHLLDSGVSDPGWPAGGSAVCTASGDQRGAQLISDGEGGAIVAWEDYRSGTSWDIYAQRVLASGEVLGVGELPSGQAALSLLPPRPNPLRSGCVLDFDLPQAGRLRVIVLDVRGAAVRRLADQEMGAGRHSLAWDGRDDLGRLLPGGIYWVRVGVGSEFRARRVAVIR